MLTCKANSQGKCTHTNTGLRMYFAALLLWSWAKKSNFIAAVCTLRAQQNTRIQPNLSKMCTSTHISKHTCRYTERKSHSLFIICSFNEPRGSLFIYKTSEISSLNQKYTVVVFQHGITRGLKKTSYFAWGAKYMLKVPSVFSFQKCAEAIKSS